MKIIILSLTTLAVSLLLTACGSDQQQIATGDPLPMNANTSMISPTPGDDEYWARENFDLQRVGSLLERSDSPQEFERYLNQDDGINNLDLNGDGYVDYISVDEFGDRDGERGLSLYTRFGPDLIQEVASAIFYRDDLNAPGARILLRGNEQIYGDNYYYEANWLDRTVDILTTLFGDRDDYYRSPYYYDNYPDDYVLYEVVGPSFYRTRIERIYPAPVFVYTTHPAFLNKIKIKSPHNGKWMKSVYARLAKPNREQLEFKKNNPGKPPFVKKDKSDKPGKEAKDSQRGKPDDPGSQGKNPNDDGGKGRGGNPGKGKNEGQGKGKKP